MKMDDFDSVMTVCSTKSSIDSGFDNGFLSDSSSTSSKSDCCARTHPSTCVFEEITGGPKNSHHCCVLNVYNISGRCIETLSPRTFLYLASCVRVLDLSNNKIKTLPDTICELQNLQELNLSCNELLSIPDSCARLKKLQVLNLSENQLIETPSCLELGMEQITHLDLSKNYISKCPNPPKCSPVLLSLNLSHNCLNLLPLWLFTDQTRSIVELDVSFNFSFDDPSLKKQLPLIKHHRTSILKCLKKLVICNNGLNLGLEVPLFSFECLKSLHIGNFPENTSTYNHFSEIPVSLFYNPENIVELHLPKLGLAGLPEDIYRFKNLEILDASSNLLDWLPETFGLLKSLKELILNDCNLSYLPVNFGELQCLRKLVIDHNKLTDVRSSLANLSSLEYLDLYDNLLEELPVSYDHLQKLHMVDLAHNYIDLETVLDIEVGGERLWDVYGRQQARLRESGGSGGGSGGDGRPRGCSPRADTNVPSWESSESLYKHHHTSSFSDVSQPEENSSYQYCFNKDNNAEEENWDEESSSGNDEFEPDLVARYHLPPGLYHFGWTPPVRRRECQVPFNQQASGFVYVPGQWHQKTTVRRRRRRVRDQPVAEGQFDDQVDDIADLQKAESLGALLRRTAMFVRNPAGLRTKRRCRFHSPYEDCLDPGLWFRVGPVSSFELPPPRDDDSDGSDDL